MVGAEVTILVGSREGECATIEQREQRRRGGRYDSPLRYDYRLRQGDVRIGWYDDSEVVASTPAPAHTRAQPKNLGAGASGDTP